MDRRHEERAEALAARQHGVVTRRQLRRCGFSDDRIDRRIARGTLRPIHRGVYRLGPLAPPRMAEMAATLAAGPGAAVSCLSSASVWQLVTTVPGDAHVTVAPGRKCSHRGIRVHRSVLSEREVTRWEGIPVTTPARTLLDIAGELNGRSLERAVAEAFARGLVTGVGLQRILRERPHWPGARTLHRLLAAGGAAAFTRSEAEESLLRLLRRGGLPEPSVNGRLAGVEVDFHWPAARLAVEVDGHASHGSARAFESDRRRDALLVAAGWRVMRVTWRQLTEEPESTLVRITQALTKP